MPLKHLPFTKCDMVFDMRQFRQRSDCTFGDVSLCDTAYIDGGDKCVNFYNLGNNNNVHNNNQLIGDKKCIRLILDK